MYPCPWNYQYFCLLINVLMQETAPNALKIKRSRLRLFLIFNPTKFMQFTNYKLFGKWLKSLNFKTQIMCKQCRLIDSFLRLFYDDILAANIIWYWMRLEDNHKWWIGKDLEGGIYSLFQGMILTFTWKHWGKSWNSSVMIAGNLTKIQTRYIPNTSLEL